MTAEPHERLIVIGLEAGAEYGFALAGGNAVRAHRVVARCSDDVDLFTSWDRRDELAVAGENIVAAYRRHGLGVVVSAREDAYVRLLVGAKDGTADGAEDRTDGASGDGSERVVKVELVADFRLRPPVRMRVGPVLHLDDVAAGKVSALFARAAARDYIDVAALLSGGHYTRGELLALAAERDAGFVPEIFAQMLAGIHRYKDADFLRYGIDPGGLDETRRQIADWRRDLAAA